MEGPKSGKIYFSENSASNLLFEGTKIFRNVANKFNRLLEKNNIREVILDEKKDGLAGKKDNPINLDLRRNEEVNVLFLITQESLT